MGLKIGMVGVGSFGRVFVPLFQHHPLVERIALCDIDAGRLAACAMEFNITETYPDLDAICKTDLDALVVITQHWLHAPQAIQAMQAGKHVYSAVPVISLADGNEMLDWCDRVVDTARRTGQYYMMGETSWYRPEAMYCRRRAAAGDFGHICHAEGSYFHDIDSPECSLRIVWQMRWADRWDMTKSGEPPMHYPTHSIGGFLSAMPDTHVTELSAFGYHEPGDDWHRIDTESGNPYGNETALLKLSNGATAIMREFRRIGTWTYEGFSLYGTQGAFIDSFGHCRWSTKAAPPEAPLTVEEMADPLPPDVAKAYDGCMDEGEYGGHGGSHPHLVHEFLTALAQDRQPAVNAWVAARLVAPGAVAHLSATEGGTCLKVPDWGNAPQ